MGGEGYGVPSWVADREGAQGGADYGSFLGQDTVVPDKVKTFVSYFYRHIREKNVYEILYMYETSFALLSEKFFKASSWPTVQLIAPLVDNDHVFCLLYREMYFRHLYAKCNPTVEQRCESWDNYCSLFGVILHGNVNMQLPALWLWEMIDEFIYQFQSFSQYRGRLSTKTAEEIEVLKRCDPVWNVLGVLNYLQALIDKSGILSTLEQEKKGEIQFSKNDGYDYNSSNVLRLLGYYSMVGLLRVHTLIGDYHSALKAIESINLSEQGMFTKTTGCYITTLYYVGFSYLQMRRYTDAIKTFNNILCYIIRNKQYLQRLNIYEQIMKKNEQVYALLAIAIALSGQGKLLDEVVNSNLREKYNDKMGKMVQGDEAIVDELFSYACPKFITPHPPSFEDPSHNYNAEAYRLQLRCFLSEISSNKLITTLRSFLKLYTTISVQKLAMFLEVDEPTLRTALCNLKRMNRQRQATSSGAVLECEWVTTTDVDFYIDDGMVHVVDNKVTRQYGDYFASNILKFERIMQDLSKAPDLVF